VERGYAANERWVVEFSDGRTAFLKIGNDDELPGLVETTAHGLRKEHSLYSKLESSFVPEMLDWFDQDGLAILVLEDLSQALWPPPWSASGIESVLEALSSIRVTRLSGLPLLQDEFGDDWSKVSNAPSPFLRLGLCSEHWLRQALPVLIDQASRAPLEGAELLHCDVRSDNICLIDGKARLIDWNWAAMGNGDFDIAFWLPSLHAEGGPPPEAVLPGRAELAALTSGFFAARAGLPVIPALPRVRDVQLQQLRTALPWAVRVLDLPPLDGPPAGALEQP
jgi:hypothetical protein